MKNKEFAFLGEIFEDFPFGVVIASSHNKVLKVNKQFKKRFGLLNKDLIDNELSELIGRDFFIKIEPCLRSLSKKKKKFCENIENNVNGNVESLVVSGKKVSIDNRFLRILFFIDLPPSSSVSTEEKHKLTSNFISQLNHEIRTPLNAVIGMSEMLLDTKLNKEQINNVLQIIDSSHQILHKLVEFTSSDSHKLEEGISDSKSKADKGIKLENLRVLVAEDDKVNQKVTMAMFKKLGCQTVLVENGKEALKAWERGHYDLILMDVQMPVMSGIEATKIIREKERKTGKHITIIAYTAFAMTEEKKEFLSAGMDEYVSKPVTFVQFFAILNQIFNFTRSTI